VLINCESSIDNKNCDLFLKKKSYVNHPRCSKPPISIGYVNRGSPFFDITSLVGSSPEVMATTTFELSLEAWRGEKCWTSWENLAANGGKTWENAEKS
jgi:hypothetical protein